MDVDPDRIVRRWWELRESLAAPKAAVHYVASGTAWAGKCGQCGHGHHQRMREIERCSRCGAAWVILEGKIPKTRRNHQPARPGTFDRGLVELGTAARLIQRIPDPARTVYVYFLDPSRGGYAHAVVMAIQAGALADEIPEWRARKLVSAAREVLGLVVRAASLRHELA